MKEKLLIWIGSSKKDLYSLPEDIIDSIGYALYFAQLGDKHDDAKVLKGFHEKDIALVEARLKQAEEIYKEKYLKKTKK
jgi:phage-related protein